MYKSLTPNELWIIENIWDVDQRFEWNERAAIIEFDGKLSREEAERKAFDAINRDAF